MPGPIPNRDADLARPRERKGVGFTSARAGALLPVEIPDPNPEWLPSVRLIWDGIISSGQKDFYQNSDLALAWMNCEYLHMQMDSGRPSAVAMNTIFGVFQNLGMTEAERRRARIELRIDEDAGESPGVTALKDYQRRLRVVPDRPAAA